MDYNQTMRKKWQNTWIIIANERQQNGICSKKKFTCKMNQRKKKALQGPLNNGPLNLPEDNMNSIAELRMNALTLELRLGSP